MRYFEVGPGGHSSLEKHTHIHIVMTLRGHGRVIIGDEIFATQPFDVMYVPPDTPHQFVNDGDEPFGFLCIVDADRDRPRPLSPEELARLRANPATAAVMARRASGIGQPGRGYRHACTLSSLAAAGTWAGGRPWSWPARPAWSG